MQYGKQQAFSFFSLQYVIKLKDSLTSLTYFSFFSWQYVIKLKDSLTSLTYLSVKLLISNT